MNQRGLLRHKADVVSISIVVLCVLTSLMPFLVPMRPWLLIVFWITAVYLRTFCAFIQHNHGHLKIFNSNFLNRSFDTLIAHATGYVTGIWDLHHVRGHHRHFLTPEKDVASIFIPGTRTPMTRFQYALFGNLTVHRDSFRVGLGEWKNGKREPLIHFVVDVFLQTAITALLLIWNPLLAVVFFVIPNIFCAWMIFWESYPHHLNMPLTTAYDASMTVENPTYNFFTFNIGHHTAHHEKPTLHWTLLPERTDKIRSQIHPDCIKKDYTTAGLRLT